MDAGENLLHPVSADGTPGTKPGQKAAPQKEKHGHEREKMPPNETQIEAEIPPPMPLHHPLRLGDALTRRPVRMIHQKVRREHIGERRADSGHNQQKSPEEDERLLPHDEADHAPAIPPIISPP